jgi:hypothetical protein
MFRRIVLFSALIAGVLAIGLSSRDVRAQDGIKFCVTNSAKVSSHFDVHYKNGSVSEKVDSGPFKAGEKCVEVPAGSTDVALTVYRQRFIVWTKVCTKSWDSVPEEGSNVTLQDGSSGLECTGI